MEPTFMCDDPKPFWMNEWNSLDLNACRSATDNQLKSVYLSDKKYEDLAVSAFDAFHQESLKSHDDIVKIGESANTKWLEVIEDLIFTKLGIKQHEIEAGIQNIERRSYSNSSLVYEFPIEELWWNGKSIAVFSFSPKELKYKIQVTLGAID